MSLESWYGQCHQPSASIDASYVKNHVVDAEGSRWLDEVLSFIDNTGESAAVSLLGIDNAGLPSFEFNSNGVMRACVISRNGEENINVLFSRVGEVGFRAGYPLIGRKIAIK